MSQKISVIIPTFNRAPLLEASLRSLVGQSLPRERFEVVVVDDGSTDATAEVCEELAGDLPVRRVFQNNAGIAAAKNLGIFAARFPILLFFDDDDLAHRKLLAEHLRSHEKHPAETFAVLGYTTWDPALAVTRVMHHVTEVGRFLFSYPGLETDQLLNFSYFWGGRSSCKRSFVTSHGIFDPQFTFGSEDIELGYRLARHGLQVVFNRRAKSTMNRPLTFDEFCRRCEKQGRSQFWFSRLHPDPVIQKYCMTPEAERKWAFVERGLEQRAARVRELEAELPPLASEAADEALDKELASLYTWCFTAFKYKGLVEESRRAEPLPGPTVAMPAASNQDQERARQKWSAIPELEPRRENVLVIDPFLPMYDRASGSLRLLHILKALRDDDCHVTFVARDPRYAETYLPLLQSLGVETHAGDPRALEHQGIITILSELDLPEILARRRYDTVILSMWHIADYYLPLVRQHSPHSKIVIDTVDIHFLREERAAEIHGDAKQQLHAAQIREREVAIYCQADRLWVVTGEDRDAIAPLVGEIPIDVLPNVHELVEAEKEYSKTRGLLFVGNFNHLPNRDGVLWFCREVWPRIAPELPDATLTIAGNNPPAEIEALAGRRVEVTGYVPDLSLLLERARLSVAPLRYGAGMKGKVGEALAWGLPVVTTAIGAEGMDLRDGEELLVADTAEELAKKTVRAYRDEALWRRLSEGGRRAVRARWSPASIRERLRTVREELHPRQPLVSIVILTFNQLPYTRECVESIERHTPEPHEILFIDNGSTDGTVKWLRKQAKKRDHWRLIENHDNLGFSRGCNQGMAAARGDYILLLNNDVVVTPEWLSGLLECHARAPRAGLVGPMTNHISGPQQVASVGYESLDNLDAYAAEFRGRHRHRRIAKRRLVGFCLLMHRSLIAKVGAFDERFGTGNYEDDDYCLRSALAGYTHWIAGDVFIHHHGSQSFKGNRIPYHRTLAKNRELYHAKWGELDSDSPRGQRLLVVQTMEQAGELHARGDTRAAVAAVVQAIARMPDELELFAGLAELLLDAGEVDSALEALAPVSDRNDARVAYLLGCCAEGGEQWGRAAECAARSLELSPNYAPAMALQARLALRGGDVETVQERLGAALDADPALGLSYTVLGMLWQAAGDSTQALEAYEHGFLLAPNSADAAVRYYQAATAAGALAPAAERFCAARAFWPSHRRLLFLSVDLLSRLGELEAAMHLTQEAMLTFGFDDSFLAAALDLRRRLEDSRDELPAPHLSVCMIARDEETTLPRCLASVASIADEIVVVDTGSADRTREVARVFGARMFEHPWTGDFSAARNHSLEQARGQWILVLDADETLAGRDLEPLRELTGAAATTPRAYTITTRNYVRSTNKTGWVGNRGEYAEETGTGWYPSNKVRLFSNDRRIRFENAVHELVEPALERIGIEPRPADIPVHHFGKLEEERVAEKGARYLELGIKKLDESTSPKALFELAVQAGELDRHADAVSLFERLLARPNTPEELVFKAELNLGHGYTQVGRHQDALQISQRALAHRPDSPDAIVNFALAQLWSGEVEEATAPLEDLVRCRPDFAPAVGLLAVAALLSHQWAAACRQLDRLSDLGLRSQPYLVEHVQKLLAVGRPERAHALVRAARAAGRSSAELDLLAADLWGELDTGEDRSVHDSAKSVDALAG